MRSGSPPGTASIRHVEPGVLGGGRGDPFVWWQGGVRKFCAAPSAACIGRHGPDPSPLSSGQAVQQELNGQRGLRPAVLRPRLQRLHGGGGGEVPLQVPLVLLRGVQEVPAAGGEIRLQIAPGVARGTGGLPRGAAGDWAAAAGDAPNSARRGPRWEPGLQHCHGKPQTER